MSAPSGLPPILLVDDEPDDLFFARAGDQEERPASSLVNCSDGSEAIAYFENVAQTGAGLPCFVFTDLKMPQVSGVDLLTWICAKPEFRKIPLVVISSSSLERDREVCYAAGAKAYLVKFPAPEHIAQLLQDHG